MRAQAWAPSSVRSPCCWESRGLPLFSADDTPISPISRTTYVYTWCCACLIGYLRVFLFACVVHGASSLPATRALMLAHTCGIIYYCILLTVSCMLFHTAYIVHYCIVLTCSYILFPTHYGIHTCLHVQTYYAIHTLPCMLCHPYMRVGRTSRTCCSTSLSTRRTSCTSPWSTFAGTSGGSSGRR